MTVVLKITLIKNLRIILTSKYATSSCEYLLQADEIFSLLLVLLALSFSLLVSSSLRDSDKLEKYLKIEQGKTFTALDLAVAELVKASQDFRATCNEYRAIQARRAANPPKPGIFELLRDFSIYQFFLLVSLTIIRDMRNLKSSTDVLDIFIIIMVNDILLCEFVYAYGFVDQEESQ